MSELPRRIQKPPGRGWKPAANVVFVGRWSTWQNPFIFMSRTQGLARVPGIDGSAWEYEGRCSAPGADHAFHHPDGKVTHHKVRLMTRAECLETYRRALLIPEARKDGERNLWDRHYTRSAVVDGKEKIVQYGRLITVDVVRAELAGKHLACNCAPGQLCHGDVLLEVANQLEFAQPAPNRAE